jgi:hypothetical protein
MTEEQIEAKYEELYVEAKKIFTDNDICGFKKNNGICNREKDKIIPNPYCCCNGNDGGTASPRKGKYGFHCRFFKEGEGCSVHSLMCKCWYCDHDDLKENIGIEQYRKLQLIRLKANKYGFYAFRGVLKDAIKAHKSRYELLLKAKNFEEFDQEHKSGSGFLSLLEKIQIPYD